MATELPTITFESSALEVKQLFLRRDLMMAGGLLVSSLAIIVVCVLWLWPTAQKAHADLKKAKADLQVSTLRSTVLTGIDPEDQANFLRAAQTLPPSKEPLVILQALADVSQEAGVTMSEYTTNPGVISTGSAVANRSAPTRRVQSLDVSVEMSGTFQQIRQALELLESASPIMEVTELSLSPRNRNQADPGAAEYTSELKVTTYFMPATLTGSQAGTAKELTAQQAVVLETIRFWRNHLPESVGTPEMYSRTNLFQLEVPGPGETPLLESSEPEQSASQPENSPLEQSVLNEDEQAALGEDDFTDESQSLSDESES